MEWVAVITLEKTAPKPNDPFASMKNRPKRTNGSSLINFFTDFDEKACLWKKRYASEAVENEEWRYYLDDISAFTELIDRVLADIPTPPVSKLRQYTQPHPFTYRRTVRRAASEGLSIIPRQWTQIHRARSFCLQEWSGRDRFV